MINLKIKFIKYIFGLAVALSSLLLHADTWLSVTELKYKNQSQELFTTYLKAKDINEKWNGNKELIQEAQRLLLGIIKKDNTFSIAYRELVRVNIALYSWESWSILQNIDLLNTAIKIDPDYAEAYVLLGHIYTILREYEKADEALTKAEEIGTSLPWLKINRAALYKKKGRFKEALRTYEEVISSGTKNIKSLTDAYTTSGYLSRKLGDIEQANFYYKKTTLINPNRAWNWGNYAAFLLYYYNDPDGAIINSEIALSKMNYGQARTTLAYALYTKWARLLSQGSDKSEIQSFFDKAYSLKPNLLMASEKFSNYDSTRKNSSLFYNIGLRQLQNKEILSKEGLVILN